MLAKVVYHKLADPDHKKLRTLVADGVLQHVNNGYCSLLEPKSISGGQFAEWITGRNPGTYVAVHYIKLIDFTFGPDWSLDRVAATGQRGLVGPADGPTWDSVQLQVVYRHPDGREAAFDIHTSWVTPDNFPGYVEQEVQFRFDNGVWNAHQRKRGVEVTVEGRTPGELKNTPNHHYNGTFLEPWGERSQRGYGDRDHRAVLPRGGVRRVRRPAGRARRAARGRCGRWPTTTCRPTGTAWPSCRRWKRSSAGRGGHPGCVVKVNGPAGGLVLYEPGNAKPPSFTRGGFDALPCRRAAMNDKRSIHISKFLSQASSATHPKTSASTLEPGGWVLIDDLTGWRRDAVGLPITREELAARRREHATSSGSPSTTPARRIRANQGHSAEVDLQLEPAEPPAELYHGTAEHNLARDSPRRPARRWPATTSTFPPTRPPPQGRFAARQTRRSLSIDAARMRPTATSFSLRERRLACRTRSRRSTFGC